MKTLFGRLFFVVGAALLVASTIHAQTYRGTITGAVTDATGAVVAGAQVQVMNEDTKFVFRATTNSDGLYTMPFLTPGTYEVTVAAKGFTSAKETHVTVIASDTKQVDFRLSVASAAQTLTVTADVSLIQTESASVVTPLPSLEIHNAPNVDGNVYMMATRVAGMYSNFTQNTESNQWMPVGGGVSGMFSEGQSNASSATMNGISILVPEGGPGAYTGYIPPSVAVHELNVTTSTYDAEVGRTIGGVMNTVLKTGTQKLHGEASFLYGDTKFNANTEQRNALGQPRNSFIFSQPSFIVTGPVEIPKLYHRAEPKTFFTASWQHLQYKTNTATSFTGNVPTDLMRNGDFSELLNIGDGNTGVIYDPTTTVPAGASGNYASWCAPNCVPGQRQSFTQEYNEGPQNPTLCNGHTNCIPTFRFNPTAVSLMRYWPQPTPGTGSATTPGIGNYAPTTGLANPNWVWMGAFGIDHQFDERNRLHVAFFPYVWAGVNANQGFPFVNGYSGGPGYPYTFRKQWGGVIDYTKVISPTTVLNIRSGGFYHPMAIPRPGDNIDLSKLGFTGSTLSFPHSNFPQVAVSGPLGAYTSLNSGASVYQYSGVFDNNVVLSKSLHRHQLKTGFNFTLYRTDPQSPVSSFASSSSPLSFNTVFTNANPNNGTAATNGGDGFASLLLGYPSSGAATIVPAPAYGWHYWAGFVQDDWRITSKLTVNLGLRWDYMSPITERYNQLIRGFDFSSPQPFNLPSDSGTAIASSIAPPPSASIPQGYYGGLYFASPSNRLYTDRELSDRFQPRIGVSWHALPKTVLRAGFGSYFAASYPGMQNPGFSSTTNLVASNNGNYTPPTCSAAQGGDAYGFCNISNPYPNGYVHPTGSLLGLSTNLGGNVSFVGPQWVALRDRIWSIGIQQELPSQTMLDIEYHGNFIDGYGVSKNWNALPNCYYLGGNCPNAGNATALNTPVTNPMAGYLPATSPLNAAKIPQLDLYLPYPEFGSITQSIALVPGSNQRTGKYYYNALFATVTKRASHGLYVRAAFTWSHTESKYTLMNPGDPVTSAVKMDGGIPSLYLVGDLVWDLPKLTTNHFLGAAVNGWQWSHSLNWQNGTTISVPAGVYPTGISPVTKHQSLTHWFNTCYIPIVPNGQVGQTLNGVVNTAPVYGAPTNCQFGEQPAWIQQPTMALNQANGNPMHGVRLQVVPYYDMAIAKSFTVRERVKLVVRAEAHNALNITLIGGGPNTSFSSAQFGMNAPAATVGGNPVYPQMNDPRMFRFETRLSF